ncbi:MAG: hypothetical protein VX764_09335 [Planctomycetota bacterium]|nr:hypothetical protein [Planctomycetota bacterium]
MIPRSLTVLNTIVTIAALMVIPAVVSIASDQVFIDTAQVKIFGAKAGSHLGASSSGAGDVDADGIPDLIAGAPGAEGSDNDGGNAYIIRGSANVDTEIDLKFPPADSVVVLQGASPGDQLGFSVSNAGDVNGDGADDFIVGAPGAVGTDSDQNSPDTGRAYLVWGSPDLPTSINVSSLGSAGVTIIGGHEDGRFGASVSSAGDFNNDGFGDIIVGAPFEEHGSTDSGAAYLILGGPSFPSTMDLSMSHSNVALFKTGGADHRVGSSVADLEDFNGDGVSDIAITSLRYGDDEGEGSGRAWIVFGGSAPAGVNNLNGLADSGLTGTTIRVPEANHELGQAICCAGDADSDGDSEVLVSRSLSDHNPETIATVAYLVRGSSTPPASINLAVGDPSVTRYDTFFDNNEEGQSVHGVLDITGDGIDDHALGVARSVLLEVEKGTAHRIDGGQNLGASQLLDLFQHSGRGFLGLGQEQQVGTSIGSAGDFNNDRGNDMMIGAPGSQPFGRLAAGSLFVFLGETLRSPDAVESSALGRTVSLSWTNRAVYDRLDLYRDGVLLTTLPGDTQSYTDENVAEGDHTYMVDGSRRDVTSIQKGTAIRVLDPADILDCTSHARIVTFTWSNQDAAYQAIDVYRDGTLIASLPGTSEMYVDENVSYGGHQYKLIQRGDRTTTLPTFCSITVLQRPDNPHCSAAPNANNENIVQLNWANGDGSTPYEAIWIYRDGQLHQTLPGNAVSTTDTVDPGRYIYEIEGRSDSNLAGDHRAISARNSCEVVDPIAPDNLQCSSETNASGEHHVLFTWNNTDAYDQIIVEFDGTTTTIPGNMTSYNAMVASPGNYTVCIRGEKFNGESGRTCCTLSTPDPLGAVSCSSQGSTVSLAWSNGGSYDSIDISRDGQLIDTIGGGMTSYTDPQVPYGDHTYSLRAHLRLGITAAESCGLRVLSPPESMACRGEADQVRITWSNPSTAYTSIEVHRGDELIATISGDEMEYVDTGQSPGEYSYSLNGTHGTSSSDSSSCETVIPQPVNTLGTGLREGTSPRLTWAPTDVDVATVEIFRDGVSIAIVPSTTTNYIDPMLPPGTYNYCTRSGIGENYSTEICELAIVPEPPNSISCGVDSAVATVSWGNGEAYDTVILKRDGGTIHEDLAGSMTSYVDSNPGPGPHRYTVEGRIGDFVSISLFCDVTVPYPPSDLACSVSGGESSVLTWTNTEPSTSIRVYRDGDLIADLDPSSSGYTDASVAPATYEYCIINAYAHANGEKTSASSCCTLIVPAPPSGLSCLSNSGDVDLAWTNNDAYEDLTLLKDGDVMAVLAGDATSYTDPAAEPGSHTYTLSGSIEGNSSSTTDCSEDVPAAISDPGATSLDSNVSLSWSHSGPGDEVDLTRNGGALATLPSSTTSYEDEALAPGDYTYCWTMRIGDGTSPTVCTTIHVLADPSDLSCVANSGEVDISWTNNDSYGTHTLNRDGQLLAILPGGDSSYHDASAGAGPHTYDLTSEAGPSTSGTIDCSVDVPSTPTDLASTALGGDVSLTWGLPTPGTSQDLTRNGSLIATLAGDATSYTDAGQAPGDYTYCLTNLIGTGTSHTVCTSIHVLADPSGMSCDSAAGYVNLAWSNNDDYDTLTLDRDGQPLAILSGTTTSYTDDSADVGSHTYSLTATTGPSTSNTVDCTVDHFLTPPSAPSCSVTAGEVDLTWSNGDTYKTLALNRDGQLLEMLPGGTTSYHDASAGAGPHSYDLVASGGSIESEAASCSVDVPSTPENLNCSLTGGSDVQLSWTLPTNGTSVEVYRDGSLIATLGGSATSLTDTPGPGTYTYGIVNKIGDGTSPTTSCTIVVPEPLSGMTCGTFGEGNELSWTNGETYDTIQVYRDGALAGIVDGDQESFTDAPLASGTYNYELVATLSGSDTAAVSCSVTILPPPINLACTFFGAPIHLDWENSAAYDTVHIERNGVLIASLSGNIVSTIDVVASEGTYSYRIWGEHADGITTSTTCSGYVKSFLRGDANSDTRCDIADGIWVLNWLFVSGPETTCFDSADYDDNGIVTIGDAILMISYYLNAGVTPAPPANPYPDAGLDTTDDVLDCADSPY